MRRDLSLHGAKVVGGDGVALLGAQQVVEHAAPQQHRVGRGGPVRRRRHCAAHALAALGAHPLRAQQLHVTPHCGLLTARVAAGVGVLWSDS